MKANNYRSACRALAIVAVAFVVAGRVSSVQRAPAPDPLVRENTTVKVAPTFDRQPAF